jgi:tRNA nucleotidyltransferase (CCA-adding enzyme)
MKILVPQAAGEIIEQLNAHGFEAYVVGGCVRDSLLKRTPEDWDITTSASPEQVKAIFPRTVDTGIQHGTVTVLADKVGYEVTTYRIDGEYEDGRHPKSVEFTRNLTEDLRRRDFTINAMAYSDRDGLVDIFEGQKDLEQKIIRCVGNAQDRFTEDALRILRAIRFSAQLGFDIEEETKKAITVIAPNMLKVSRERIQVELTKLLVSNHPEKIVDVYESKIAPYICEPFNQALKAFSGVEGLKLLPANKHMRWAGLLRHQLPEVSVKILRELKLDNETINQVKTLVSLWNQEIPAKKPDIRKVMSKLTLELFSDLLLFQTIFGEKAYLDTLKKVEEYAKEILKDGDCIHLKDMAVTGKELIEAGRKPGPKIGEVLDTLFEEVIKNPEHNQKDYLMNLAEKL